MTDTKPSTFEELLDDLRDVGIEQCLEDGLDNITWTVEAEPEPIVCYSLGEALIAWQELSANDALRALSEKFPPRDIPIRFCVADRTIRRWQIDMEFSGREGPRLVDVFDPPIEPAPPIPEVAIGQTFNIGAASAKIHSIAQQTLTENR